MTLMAKVTTRVLVVPDMHAPYHDEAVVQCLLRVAKGASVEEIVYIGDFADFYSVSSHDKSPERRENLEEELVGVRQLLRRFDRTGVERHTYLDGNHEHRLARYVSKRAPELSRSIASMPKLLGLDNMHSTWRHKRYGVPYYIGDTTFLHDVGKCGVSAARGSASVYRHKLVFGHSHRAQLYTEGNYWAMNIGWGGDYGQIDYFPEHRARNEWQHAFGIVDFYDGIGTPQLCLIDDRGQTVVDGVRF